jgi:hypothetical protein
MSGWLKLACTDLLYINRFSLRTRIAHHKQIFMENSYQRSRMSLPATPNNKDPTPDNKDHLTTESLNNKLHLTKRKEIFNNKDDKNPKCISKKQFLM